ncbi:MAG: hypothetical protein RLZZ528_1214 [Pseudomonadota bacterium]
MQIIFHLGTHCTDEERLVRTLLRNRGALAPHGVAVPAPGRYRTVLRDALVALHGGIADRAAQEALLDSILDQDDPGRVIFTNDYFMGLPLRAIGDSGLYPTAGRRAAALANLFPDAETEFHLAIRNPATLVPALLARAPGTTYPALVGDTQPAALRWLPVIRRIAAQAPESRVVVWCNEDTPVIWPEVLRRVAGVPPDFALEGEYDLAETLMTEAGFSRMTSFLQAHPPQSISARRKILTAFLEKFHRPDSLTMEVPLPGWTDDLVAAITDDYDRECDEIRRMARVEMILP